LAAALSGQWAGKASDLVVTHSRSTLTGGGGGVVPNAFGMFTGGRPPDQMRARGHRPSPPLAGLSRHAPNPLRCPPRPDILTDNALTAADGLLVPVQAEDSSLHALELLLAQVAAVDADLRDRPLHIHGLVVSLLRRPPSTLARTALARFGELDGL